MLFQAGRSVKVSVLNQLKLSELQTLHAVCFAKKFDNVEHADY